jgi:uncharacterized protein YhfF
MVIPPQMADFWHAAVQAGSGVDESRFYETFSFGDSEALANSLADLVLTGVKRATAGSVWSCEAEGKRLPAPGDLSIVTDWSGRPLCIIETLAVDVVAFDAVTAEFAAAEGEGDGSLSFWRSAHEAYFTRECAGAGRRFSADMPVACERFRVVYQPSGGASRST